MQKQFSVAASAPYPDASAAPVVVNVAEVLERPRPKRTAPTKGPGGHPENRIEIKNESTEGTQAVQSDVMNVDPEEFSVLESESSPDERSSSTGHTVALVSTTTLTNDHDDHFDETGESDPAAVDAIDGDEEIPPHRVTGVDEDRTIATSNSEETVVEEERLTSETVSEEEVGATELVHDEELKTTEANTDVQPEEDHTMNEIDEDAVEWVDDQEESHTEDGDVDEGVFGSETDASITEESEVGDVEVNEEVASTDWRERYDSLVGEVERALDGVDAAMECLDDGTYGRCLVCGSEIRDGDLSRTPLRQFCDDHERSDR
jgi:RNA polymerase-binding transcription factor DksA